MAINEAVNQQYEKVNEKLGNILKKIDSDDSFLDGYSKKELCNLEEDLEQRLVDNNISLVFLNGLSISIKLIGLIEIGIPLAVTKYAIAEGILLTANASCLCTIGAVAVTSFLAMEVYQRNGFFDLYIGDKKAPIKIENKSIKAAVKKIGDRYYSNK